VHHEGAGHNQVFERLVRLLVELFGDEVLVAIDTDADGRSDRLG
jgi:hypothetical protein